MTSEYKVVQYNNEYRSGVLDLARHLWGTDYSRNSAYLDWKYGRNPIIRRDSPLIFLMLHRDKVVGMRGVHAMRLEAEGAQELTVPCLGDTIIDPAHRGKGLLTPLTQSAMTALADLGYLYVFGVSNAPPTYFHFLKIGARQACFYERLQAGRRSHQRIHRGYQLIRRVPILSSIADLGRGQFAHHKCSSASAEEHNVFASLDENGARDDADIWVEAKPRPPEMAYLVRHLPHDGRIRQVKDAEYLGWRYQNPLSLYRLIFFGDDNELKGYLTVQASPLDRLGIVNLVDWEATDLSILQDLLQAVKRWGGFNLLRTWSATLSHEILSLLTEEGFKPASLSKGAYRPGLLLCALKESTADESWVLGRRCLLNQDDWDLRMIQSDLF